MNLRYVSGMSCPVVMDMIVLIVHTIGTFFKNVQWRNMKMRIDNVCVRCRKNWKQPWSFWSGMMPEWEDCEDCEPMEEIEDEK